jgi:hypothetical protein
LALPAGKLARIARRKALVIEADEIQQLARAGIDLIFIPAFQPRHDADIFFDGKMREQADFLNDVADAAPEPDRVPLGRRLAFDEHVAFGGIEQAIDELQGRRLTAAAPPEQHQGLAAADLQIEIVQQGFSARQAKADVVKFDGRSLGR